MSLLLLSQARFSEQHDTMRADDRPSSCSYTISSPPKSALQTTSSVSVIFLDTSMSAYRQHFDWAENNLFFDEIPNGKVPSMAAFFFGAQDIIIDAARARKYLERRETAVLGASG